MAFEKAREYIRRRQLAASQQKRRVADLVSDHAPSAQDQLVVSIRRVGDSEWKPVKGDDEEKKTDEN